MSNHFLRAAFAGDSEAARECRKRLEKGLESMKAQQQAAMSQREANAALYGGGRMTSATTYGGQFGASDSTAYVDVAQLSKQVYRLKTDFEDHKNNHPKNEVSSIAMQNATASIIDLQKAVDSLKKELDTMHRWRRSFEEDPLKGLKTTVHNFSLDINMGRKRDKEADYLKKVNEHVVGEFNVADGEGRSIVIGEDGFYKIGGCASPSYFDKGETISMMRHQDKVTWHKIGRQI